MALLLRVLVIAFNVAAVGYLLFRMIELMKFSMPRWKKTFILLGGLILLFAPIGIFLRFFAPTIQYFIIYPVAIAMYLYMIRELR